MSELVGPSITLPRIPLVAITAPLAAMAVTGFICLHAMGRTREPPG